MYIIKHRSRRTSDKPGAFYWIVCGTVLCNTIDEAADMLFDNVRLSSVV